MNARPEPLQVFDVLCCLRHCAAGRGAPTQGCSNASICLGAYILHQIPRDGRTRMRDKRPPVGMFFLLFLAILSTAACNSAPDISGVWKGTIQASAPTGKGKWQGSAELTLNQNGDALTGTLVFTHPQAGRVQVPLTSGIVSKDSVTFSGHSQFPLGGSIDVTFHGTVSGTSLMGTADMTSRGLYGSVTDTGPLNLTKQ